MKRRRSSILGLSHSAPHAKPPLAQRARPFGVRPAARQDSSEHGQVPGEQAGGGGGGEEEEEEAQSDEQLRRRVTFGTEVQGVRGGARVSRASRVSLGVLSSNDVAARGATTKAASASHKKTARSKSVLAAYHDFSNMMLG